jgi:hypothetical protein
MPWRQCAGIRPDSMGPESREVRKSSARAGVKTEFKRKMDSFARTLMLGEEAMSTAKISLPSRKFGNSHRKVARTCRSGGPQHPIGRVGADRSRRGSISHGTWGPLLE